MKSLGSRGFLGEMRIRPRGGGFTELGGFRRRDKDKDSYHVLWSFRQ